MLKENLILKKKIQLIVPCVSGFSKMILKLKDPECSRVTKKV